MVLGMPPRAITSLIMISIWNPLRFASGTAAKTSRGSARRPVIGGRRRKRGLRSAP